MAENEISEYDTDTFFITDDNTNLTEINSINNNRNVALINDDMPDNTNETALNPSQSITKHMPKRRKIDPVWDFIDDTDNNKQSYKFCHKEYSKATGITTLKEHFKFVENADFREFIKALDPRFQLPTRQSISESILDLYNYQKDVLRTLLMTMQNKFTITTDVWSSCTNLGYLAIMLHWINENWSSSKILLDMVPLHERHTGSYIAEKIFETIAYYGIGSKILAVTTDNASSIVVFGNILNEMLQSNYGNYDFEHVRCAAHVLNLAVSDGMRVVVNSITKLRNFTSYIHRSQPIFEELKKIFEMKGQPFLVPDLDVPTQWNSTYMMINKFRRIREMTDILVALNTKLKEQYPTDEDWNEINAIATLLESIAEATNLLSASSYPTMGDLHIVFPVILKILSNALETDNNTVSIQNQIAQRMYLKLHNYWTNMRNSCYASVVLDPNVKLSSFDEETAAKVYTFIRNIYSNYTDKQPDSLTTTEDCKTSRTYFKKHFKHIFSTTGNYRRDILEEYLSSAEEDCDVLEFWRL
ncbi:unnamed protein product [Rhizophagus irregularis]|nr:unnamed protein product [Rhizophagus irregularis]